MCAPLADFKFLIQILIYLYLRRIHLIETIEL